jgi:ankyrin repeat protein
LKRGTDADNERCAEYERFKRIDGAFRAGDLAALKAAVEDPSVIPNGHVSNAIGSCLEYAVYHSPLAFIRQLLEIGADPNPQHHAGFPPLIAALSCRRLDVLKLLLSFGADPNQRGINDCTPLHIAVGYSDSNAIEILLQAGADPHLRTRIDDCETPREMAERARQPEVARLLLAAEGNA